MAKEINSNPNVPKIIWGALTASQFLYVFVAWQTSQLGAGTSDAASVAQLMPVFYGLAAATAIGSMAMLKKLGRTFVGYVVSWAMNEAICLYGFILAFLTHDVMKMAPFFTISLFMNLRTFPRLEPQIPGSPGPGPGEGPIHPS